MLLIDVKRMDPLNNILKKLIENKANSKLYSISFLLCIYNYHIEFVVKKT